MYVKVELATKVVGSKLSKVDLVEDDLIRKRDSVEANRSCEDEEGDRDGQCRREANGLR